MVTISSLHSCVWRQICQSVVSLHFLLLLGTEFIMFCLPFFVLNSYSEWCHCTNYVSAFTYFLPFAFFVINIETTMRIN